MVSTLDPYGATSSPCSAGTFSHRRRQRSQGSLIRKRFKRGAVTQNIQARKKAPHQAMKCIKIFERGQVENLLQKVLPYSHFFLFFLHRSARGQEGHFGDCEEQYSLPNHTMRWQKSVCISAGRSGVKSRSILCGSFSFSL